MGDIKLKYNIFYIILIRKRGYNLHKKEVGIDRYKKTLYFTFERRIDIRE